MPRPGFGTCLRVWVWLEAPSVELRYWWGSACFRMETGLEWKRGGVGERRAQGLRVCEQGSVLAFAARYSLPLCVFVRFASFRSKRSSEKFQGDRSQAEGEGILPTPGQGEVEGDRRASLPEPPAPPGAASPDTPGMYRPHRTLCCLLLSGRTYRSPRRRRASRPPHPPPQGLGVRWGHFGLSPCWRGQTYSPWRGCSDGGRSGGWAGGGALGALGRPPALDSKEEVALGCQKRGGSFELGRGWIS
nr:lymphocyte antigen 6H isoform X2 [Camelus dromedarius]